MYSGETHIAVAKTEKMYRGTTTMCGMNTWKERQNEYRVAATLPVTERARITVRNLPKPFAGSSIASTRPPTFPSSYAAAQDGTFGAATAAAAPRHWMVIWQ